MKEHKCDACGFPPLIKYSNVCEDKCIGKVFNEITGIPFFIGSLRSYKCINCRCFYFDEQCTMYNHSVNAIYAND